MELHKLLNALCVGVGDAASWPGGAVLRVQREKEAVRAGVTAMVENAFFGSTELQLAQFEAWCSAEPRVGRWLGRFCKEAVELLRGLCAQLPNR